ncbi:MAG: M1 family metallopeptidase [bacterium]
MLRLHRQLLCLGVILMFTHSLTAQQIPVLFPKPLSPRIANYNIDVTLEPQERMLHGQEILVWHNKTSHTIEELQFHLYLNAFRNNESTFMKESGGQLRGLKIHKNGWGFSQVDRFTVSYSKDLKGDIGNIFPGNASEPLARAADLTDRLEFIQPDDDNENDKTVFRVPLPRLLRPGESVVVDIDFTAKLPTPPFARTGAKKEYFFVGQWFPKIGVYVDGQWNCHQFHANSEFFADFGVYNVHMTVPEENVLGATGLEVEVKSNGDGTATHFYHAEDVHDFAWTTSPVFVEFNGTAQDVDIRVLMQPDHADQGPRHVAAAKVAIEHFQNWYGDYPFPNLTVVDPRRGAMGSAGMEYPTLITAGTFYGLPEGLRMVENVIIHEFGHNYWYHLLASNEFEESWMDEGINTYTEIQIIHDAYGPVGDTIDLLGIKINDLQFQRWRYMGSANLDPMVRRSWEYYSGGSYGTNSYSKPGVVLTTLQNYLGKETMQKVMRAYVARWRFKHPRTRDFIDVANEVAGEDLSWFFDQAFFSNAVLDYSVDRVFSKKVKKDRGYDYTRSVTEEDSLASDGEVSDQEKAAAPPASEPTSNGRSDSVTQTKAPTLYSSGVYVRRLGDFKFPVDVEVVFANGDTIREKWDGQALWKKFRYTKPAKLVSAIVDPEGKIPLDVNFTNNSRTVKRERLGANKLSTRWLFWMQFLLDQPEFLNFAGIFSDLF